MSDAVVITVNGKQHRVAADPDALLLDVLRNELGLRGPKFGCGLGQCGVCAVLLDKDEIRACSVPVAAVADRPITTLEGLPALWAAERGQPAGAPAAPHPLQQAWIAEQVPQCGYCQSGMMIQAASLLYQNPDPSDGEIREAMDGHICRCGTYLRIIRAIKRASAAMRQG